MPRRDSQSGGGPDRDTGPPPCKAGFRRRSASNCALWPQEQPCLCLAILVPAVLPVSSVAWPVFPQVPALRGPPASLLPPESPEPLLQVRQLPVRESWPPGKQGPQPGLASFSAAPLLPSCLACPPSRFHTAVPLPNQQRTQLSGFSCSTTAASRPHSVRL